MTSIYSATLSLIFVFSIADSEISSAENLKDTYQTYDTTKFIITGEVEDAKSGKKLEFTTLTLKDDSGKNVVYTFKTLPDGKFVLIAKNRGEYILVIESMGYKTDIRKVKIMKI